MLWEIGTRRTILVEYSTVVGTVGSRAEEQQEGAGPRAAADEGSEENVQYARTH